MKAKIQRFGGSLYVPVLFTAFAGIMTAFSIIFTNPSFFGEWATEGHLWYNFWYLIGEGGWTIFRQMPIIFAVGIPIGLAKNAQARAGLESILAFLTFNYYIQTLLELYGDQLNIDVTGPGMTEIAGITTFDMSIFGAIIVSLLVVWAHDKYYDYELPEILGTFGESVLVYIVLFFVLIPVAVLVVLVWPVIARETASLQAVIVASGGLGVWLYTFLERLLIPTGLHHLIYQPFVYGNAVVDGGATAAWLDLLPTLQGSTVPLKEVFPEGGFLLYGNSKVFGTLGMAFAFYSTALPEKKKKTLGLLIPITATAMLVGVTEPFEFSFLFVAPFLFLLHCFLAATMATVMYAFGIVGSFSSALINFATSNWIPLGSTYYMTYILQVVIGLTFSLIYFLSFRFFILKFNLKTPGREDDEEVKFYSKAEYKEMKKETQDSEPDDLSENHIYKEMLELCGGKENIVAVSNCVSRLRLELVDPSIIGTDAQFRSLGAKGLVQSGTGIQIIIGVKVGKFRAKFEEELERQRSENE